MHRNRAFIGGAELIIDMDNRINQCPALFGGTLLAMDVSNARQAKHTVLDHWRVQRVIDIINAPKMVTLPFIIAVLADGPYLSHDAKQGLVDAFAHYFILSFNWCSLSRHWTASHASLSSGR